MSTIPCTHYPSFRALLRPNQPLDPSLRETFSTPFTSYNRECSIAPRVYTCQVNSSMGRWSYADSFALQRDSAIRRFDDLAGCHTRPDSTHYHAPASAAP